MALTTITNMDVLFILLLSPYVCNRFASYKCLPIDLIRLLYTYLKPRPPLDEAHELIARLWAAFEGHGTGAYPLMFITRKRYVKYLYPPIE
jgi:hypothetical protein